MSRYGEIFTEESLKTIFPESRTDAFFEALFGDAEEGSYDIALAFVGEEETNLNFELRLVQRPGKCLACNLTYGLPQVFSRHPVINLAGIANAVGEAVGSSSASWELGATCEMSRELHVIPLKITLG
ncbi:MULTISPECIES: pancreas/duodenum homeobox protein 1 [unclassified Pseudodesulfovibrio]|uniref:pancreas/duodenum homeobox protein 1 n=1 Tax=unclassified Pseudodesulfovibrio TaxID=2661612 RepID=UPI000FEB83F0|nr:MULTISPECIES: pancreas/duodenum homeobox protein 1 [unclassified Pseudodesulfovibrio]MCJ2165035.1 pancreas/duodenum homeobox protein 1 [Pseudodesulfovibrio sp. S3-i]RWU03523.1 pancreas/duodenum homeobox protein 1 [Pseudodesulfovibrio sp. S3]